MENLLDMSIEAYMVLLEEGARAGNLALVEKAGMCGMDGARMCQSFVSLTFGLCPKVETSVRFAHRVVPPTLAEEFIKFYMTLV